MVSRRELLEHFWDDHEVYEEALTRCISTIRKALDDHIGEPRFIHTQWAEGYRFIGDVEEKFEGAANSTEIQRKTRPARRGKTAEDLPFRSGNKRRFGWWAVIALGFCVIVAGLLQGGFSGAKFGEVPTFERMRQTRLTQTGDVIQPVISPDGQYLVYVSLGGAQCGLCLRQIATGQVLELLPPRPNVRYWSNVFSKDSNYVYYTESIDGIWGAIYRIPSLGGQPQKVVEFANSGPTVSPDGERLAFVRIDKQKGVTSIFVVNGDGSQERTLAATDTDSIYQSIDWSPDGDSLAVAVKHHEPPGDSWYLAEIPAAGGTERRIGQPRDDKIIKALWLPGKQGFIMNAIDPLTRQPQIYYLSYPDGTERRVTNDLNNYFGVSITADGKTAVTQRIQQNREIWILPGSGGRRQAARQLTFKKDQHFEMVGWLSNDTIVFDVDENGTFDNRNIWRLKIGEPEPQPVTTGTGDNAFPAVSPDGRTIAFISRRSGKPQIWRMNADGTQAGQVTDWDYDIFDLQFAPGGETLYFKTSIGGKGRLMRVSINGGAAVSLSETDIYRWAISPDGNKLAYSALDAETQKIVIRIRPADTDVTEKTLNIEPVNWLQWSKDGQALDFALAADGAKNIWRQLLSENQPQRTTDFDRQQIFRFFPSPDGKNIACIRLTDNFDAIKLSFK
jgi:Tol biopolymer transport system component